MSTFNTEEELHTLSEEELRFWNKGYLSAVEGFLEQITDDQIKILNKVHYCEENGEQKEKESLLTRLRVLDIYEKHYRTRLKYLRNDVE